jgi:DNA-binding transcriptional regulator YiaG
MNEWTGEAIRHLRAMVGDTQPEFARRLKVASITVSRWERAKQRIDQVNRRRLDRLAKRVGFEGV